MKTSHPLICSRCEEPILRYVWHKVELGNLFAEIVQQYYVPNTKKKF